MMEIPVIQGRSFTENVTNSREVMVDRRFVEKMKLVAGWTDDVVGKDICVTEHSKWNEEPFTIAACMRISVWEESRTKICGPPYYSMRISPCTPCR